jgi:hypothetical protein
VSHLHLNHWAVLACGAALWMLGAVWYSPALFSKPWARLLDLGPSKYKKHTLMVGMICSFIGDLLTAFVLDHVILWSGAKTFAAGALIGFIAWVGFFAAPAVPQGIYEARPFKLFLINSGYWFVGLLIVGGVLAVWR